MSLSGLQAICHSGDLGTKVYDFLTHSPHFQVQEATFTGILKLVT